MKIIICITLLVSVASAINIQGKLLAPLSDDMVNYVNKVKTTWKAEKSKFDSWSLKSFKKILGVPLNYIGKPSRLEVIEHQVDLSALPVEFDSRTQWPNCPTIGEVYI